MIIDAAKGELGVVDRVALAWRAWTVKPKARSSQSIIVAGSR